MWFVRELKPGRYRLCASARGRPPVGIAHDRTSGLRPDQETAEKESGRSLNLQKYDCVRKTG